ASLRPLTVVGQTRLAWLLATHPNPTSRDVPQALERAGKAVALEPRRGNAWEALGAARYRANDWSGAIAAMQKARQIFADRAGSYQSFWLAMAHWHLGDEEQARQWFHQGVQWLEEH